MDSIFNKISKQKDYEKILKNLENIEKIINIKNFKNLTKNNNILLKITKKIISCYIVCSVICNNFKQLEKIKTKLIKEKHFNSEELGIIFKLSDDINTLKKIVNDENLEKLAKEYHSNIKIRNIINILNKLGFDYVINNLKGTNDINIHKIIKTIIYKNYYQKSYRKKIFNIIQSESAAEYEFIEIILPKIKITNFNNIENILSSDENKYGLAQEIYDFVSDYEETITKFLSIDEHINILFKSKIILPIVDDFLRYHKLSENYNREITKKNKYQKRKKDNTKIRYIISKIEKIKDYYSKKIQNNLTLKKEVEKLFYKPLRHRKAIIMNEFEELSIINKLKKQGKTAIESNEFYYDLINLRKSAYVNFRDFKSYGFNLFLTDSINSIRYAPIEYLENKTTVNKSLLLEYRFFSKQTKIKIIGISFITKKLNSLRVKDIQNIHNNKNNNGYQSFKNNICNNIKNKKSGNYYWLFNINRDKNPSEFYEINNTINEKSKLLIKDLYYDISFCIYNKIYNKINKYDELYLYNSNKIIDYYQKKYFNLDSFVNGKNLYSKLKILIKNKIPIIKSFEDKEEDKIYGMIGKVYKLPIIKKKKRKIASMIIPYKDNIEDEILFEVANAYCQHTIDWSNLSRLRKNNPNKHIQLLYNFIEKYVMTNDDNVYICKSCKQILDIQSFLSNVYDGGSEGIDIIITSTRALDEIYDYRNYKSSIKNMDKIIERIAQITNYNYFIGNQPVHKLRRQDIIKQTIDLINLHDSTLRTNNMNKRKREMEALNKYGISSDNSNFFIFPLSNDIFKFSSKEIDKYKKIKLNNIIVYIIFLMLLEINHSQIINIEFDKSCNLFLFEKFGIKLFDNLYIRINTSNDIVLIKKYKTLCFVIFYYSCMISKYNLWYTPIIDDKKQNVVQIQQNIVHTIVDMINSIMEIYNRKDKHFLYKILCSKFSNKLKMVFKNDDILDDIKLKENKKIIFDVNSNRIKIIKSKIPSILLNGKLKLYEDTLYDYNKCRPNFFYIKKKMPLRDIKVILSKTLNEIRKNMIHENMRKLAMIYDKDGNILKYKLSFKDTDKISYSNLQTMMKNINKHYFKKIIKQNNIKNILDIIKKNASNVKNKIQKIDYIQKIIDLINKNIGNTIKIRSILYYTEENQLILEHDYLGNKLNKSISIKYNDKKIRVKDNLDLKTKVYEINDKLNDIILYYNYYTLHFLGYKDLTRGFINMKSLNIYIRYLPSIKTIIKTLGFKKINYEINTKNDAINELRKASYNLKEYIRQIETGIYQIRYKIKSIELNPVIKYYQKKISNLEIRGNKGKIFKNWDDYIKIQKIIIDDNIYSGNISAYNLAKKSKSYNEIISYLISQILIILEYNKDKFIKSQIIFYFISFIIFLYNLDFEQYTDFEMIKFNYILDSFDSIQENLIYSNEERENLSDEQQNIKKEQNIDYIESTTSRDTEPIENEET